MGGDPRALTVLEELRGTFHREAILHLAVSVLAEAAVLPGLPKEPFGRFTPKAAPSRLDNIRGGSCFALMLRTVRRSCRAASTDLPPSLSGFGREIGCGSWVGPGVSCAKLYAVLAKTVTAGKAFTNVLRFIGSSSLIAVICNSSDPDVHSGIQVRRKCKRSSRHHVEALIE